MTISEMVRRDVERARAGDANATFVITLDKYDEWLGRAHLQGFTYVQPRIVLLPGRDIVVGVEMQMVRLSEEAYRECLIDYGVWWGMTVFPVFFMVTLALVACVATLRECWIARTAPKTTEAVNSTSQPV